MMGVPAASTSVPILRFVSVGCVSANCVSARRRALNTLAHPAGQHFERGHLLGHSARQHHGFALVSIACRLRAEWNAGQPLQASPNAFITGRGWKQRSCPAAMRADQATHVLDATDNN